MPTPFPLKTGDLLPRYRARLLDARRKPIDLTLATAVIFKMRAQGSIVNKVNRAASVVNALGGIVEYQWQGNDTDTPGDFDTQFVISWGGSPQTVPPSGFGLVRISSTF